MSIRKFVINSLLYYWRTHLGVVLGTAISVAVLVGALVVGDSVQYSLKKITLDRLGRIEYALDGRDRFYRQALADELGKSLDIETAAIIKLDGMVVGDANNRLNQVTILGITDHFFDLADGAVSIDSLNENKVMVNQALAEQLNVKVGDFIIVRIEKTNVLPRDVPLVSIDDSFITKRYQIIDILTTGQFGRFSLQTNQVAPYNLFLPIETLAREMNLEGKANVLLVSSSPQKYSLNDIQKTLAQNWTLEDAGLSLTTHPELGEYELVSNRIFIEHPVINAVQSIDTNHKGLFTYFVNQFKIGDNTSPYSFISAPGEPVVPKTMSDDQMIINQWLADDLKAKTGDKIEIRYYIINRMRRLQERNRVFTVKSIVPIRGRAADRQLMPDFPGLADADNCSDWDPGIPIDLNRIRTKDEAYWDKYRGTPKAFVTLNAAQQMWSNRFGELTAIRFDQESVEGMDQLSKKILSHLPPSALGFFFSPIREEGLGASSQGVDFGELFIGLSFFVIVAALLLTVLLYVFSIKQRSREIGLLLAVGFTSRDTKKVMLVEGMFLVILGGILGSVAGIAYDKLVLYALGTVWRGAVGTSDLYVKVEMSTLFLGGLAGIFIALFSLWLALGNQIKKPVIALQRGQFRFADLDVRFPWKSLILASLSVIAVVFILFTSSPGRGREAQGVFFGAGALMLTACLSFCYALLILINRSGTYNKLDLKLMALRTISRRKLQSLTIIGLLSCGLFIIFAVGANRHQTSRKPTDTSSGTGGYEFFAETSIPILHDLNDVNGRTSIGLNTDIPAKFTQMRLLEGDDASCLNLNRTQKPRILGINPEMFNSRGSFTFVKRADWVDPSQPWLALEDSIGNNVIPAIADQTVIVWGLGKTIGDTLSYLNEKGETIYLKLAGGLANSVFQGNVLISEENFTQHFPSTSGYQVFLIDTPLEKTQTIANDIRWALEDHGLGLVSTEQRLAAFNRVQNTYLSIFMALGGLGLLLGSIGLAIVVLRNTLERRGELALLQAVGFGKSSIFNGLIYEHGLLLIAGIISGMLAAIIAVLPAIMTPGSSIPVVPLLIILTVILGNGYIWIYFSTQWALRGNLLESLRNE